MYIPKMSPIVERSPGGWWLLCMIKNGAPSKINIDSSVPFDRLGYGNNPWILYRPSVRRPRGRGPLHRQRSRVDRILGGNDESKLQKQPKLKSGDGPSNPSVFRLPVLRGEEVLFLLSDYNMQHRIRRRRRRPVGPRGLGTPNEVGGAEISQHGEWMIARYCSLKTNPILF